MKKRFVWILAAVLVLALTALVVRSVLFRRITVVSGEQFIDQCPRYALPGREVTVTTAVVADGEIYVNGADGSYVRPGVYVFTMPDGDVQLKVTVIANPNGA